MKAVLCLALLAVCATALTPLKENEYQFLFTRFIAEHNKAYATNEFFHRFSIFKNNIDYIRMENQKNHTYTLGMNQFGDLTAHEFKTDVVGGCLKAPARPTPVFQLPKENIQAPTPVNWADKGAVQKVKNQAQCGSCWAFSAIGAVEGAWQIAKGGQVPDLSEQQLVDCSGSEGNEGCNGGLMTYAFQYLIKFGGSVGQTAYPYTARDGSCKAKTSDIVATISKFESPPANEEQLGKYLDKGPISVAVEADQSIFQFYRSGVLDGNCGRNLDHGVLAVGYGSDAKNGYWIVKNSWGASWGNQGYVWIRFGKNMCGIAGDLNAQPYV